MEECNKVQRLGENHNSMYWILYQTVNLRNNKIYIGVHQTKNPYVFDGYIGNGVVITQPCSYMKAHTPFEAAVKSYGPKSFRRTVLKIFDNEADAYKAEAMIVDEDFLKRPDVYNLIPGGKIPYIRKATTLVYQYSLEGKLLQSFISFKEAASSVRVNSASLSEACSNHYSCAGFYWSKVKQKELDVKTYHPTQKPSTLYMYDLSGNFVRQFDSTRSTGYTQASMSAETGNLVDGKYRFCTIKAPTFAEARSIYIKNRLVFQYDSTGKFLKSWKYLEALKAFPHDSINQAIRHKTLTKSGYFWGLREYQTYNEPIVKQQRKIAKYDLEGNLVATYKNAADCYKHEGRNVYKNLVGLRKSYKGFNFKYIE